MKKIEAVVRLSYPVTNMPNGKTTNDGRYAELLIEDGASGETLARIDLSPQELMRIMGSEIVRVSDGAMTDDHLDRVGKKRVTDTVHLGYRQLGFADPQVKAAVADALALGWDEATPHRNRDGWQVTCRKWVDDSDATTETGK